MIFELEERPGFFKEGACWGLTGLSHLFFPAEEEPGLYDEGRKYCNRCPVATDCRDYAIRNQIHDGLWGGLDPRERERYRRNPKTWERSICEECGGTLAGRQRIFCSPKCAHRSSVRRKKKGMILPFICKRCGKEFIRHNRFQLMCSDKCRNARRDAPIPDDPCEICGGPIRRPDARTRVYCSDECRTVGKQRVERRRNAERKRG